MRPLKCVFAAAAIGGLMTFAQTGSATPLANALGTAGAAMPVIADDLVQKVHGWHCYKRKGWYHGHRVWHRHRRACYKRYYDDDYYDDDYYDYGYYRPYRRHYAYPYYYGGGPFIGFSFGGGRHGWGWDD